MKNVPLSSLKNGDKFTWCGLECVHKGLFPGDEKWVICMVSCPISLFHLTIYDHVWIEEKLTFKDVLLGQRFIFDNDVFVKVIPFEGWNAVGFINNRGYTTFKNESVAELLD